jgi:uncharacterized protein YdcH (DUF465 family)
MEVAPNHPLASSEAFRKLANEHSQYAQRLETLANKPYLSQEEKLEEVRLKKLKLKLKDEMALLEHNFLVSHNVA